MKLLPLVQASLEAVDVPSAIPNDARSPEGVRTALLIRAGDWDMAHQVAQDLNTPEGSFWHGILHRQERDGANAAYWFRRAGRHPVYPLIHSASVEILNQNPNLAWKAGREWDPEQFISWCLEAARHPGSTQENVVSALQIVEWLQLFHYCLSPLDS